MQITSNSFFVKFNAFKKADFLNLSFFIACISTLYYNFWQFFTVIGRPIDRELYSSISLHITTCLTLSLVYFLPYRFRSSILWVILFINCYLVCNLLYYRTYFTLLPLDSYMMIGNLSDLGGSISSAFHPDDLHFFLPTAILFPLYHFFLKNRLPRISLKRRLLFSSIILTFTTAVISINLYLERHEISNLLSDENEFKYDILDGASTYGFLHCWSYQFQTAIQGNEVLTKEDKSKIDNWLAQHQPHPQFLFSPSCRGKNLLLIIVESLESFPIDTQVNGQEIAPFLTRLTHQNNSLYAPNLIPQVNIGHSSDCQLILNTGLLPPHAGAACFKYPHNTYPTLAEALRKEGYASHTLLGGVGSFWNQGVTTKTLGYNDLIDIQQYNQDETFEFGLTDSTFFAQSVDKIAHFKSPFLAQMITLSSHDPYVMVAGRQYLQSPKGCPEELSRYLNAINYVDRCLSRFLETLKTKGLLDQTLVVITGDHQATKQNPEEWNRYITQHSHHKMGRTPLIIAHFPGKRTIPEIHGQIDVYPTLIDLMGLNSYSWHGLGKSMLSQPTTAVTANAQFEYFGATPSPSPMEREAAKSIWETSDLIIRKNYFAHLQQ